MLNNNKKNQAPQNKKKLKVIPWFKQKENNLRINCLQIRLLDRRSKIKRISMSSKKVLTV
jgi:hypothetical protein